MNRLTEEELKDLAKFHHVHKVGYGLFGGLQYKITKMSPTKRLTDKMLNEWKMPSEIRRFWISEKQLELVGRNNYIWYNGKWRLYSEVSSKIGKPSFWEDMKIVCILRGKQKFKCSGVEQIL